MLFALLISCSSTQFDRTASIYCAQDYPQLHHIFTHEESGSSFYINPEDRTEVYTGVWPSGEYLLTSAALDSARQFVLYERREMLELGADWDARLVDPPGPLTIQGMKFTYGVPFPEITINGIHSECGVSGDEIMFYTSNRDPRLFANPMTFFSDDSIFQIHSYESGAYSFTAPDSLFYFGASLEDDTRAFRTRPFMVGVPDRITEPLNPSFETSLKIFEGYPRWYSLDVALNHIVMMEVFDADLKSIAGRKPLVSVYSADESKTYFEDMPFWGPDLVPRAIFKNTDDSLLVKFEIDPEGQAGKIQTFIRNSNELGHAGIDTIIESDLWTVGPFLTFHVEAESGNHTLTTWQDNPEAKTFRYSLFDVGTGETLIDYELPNASGIKEHEINLIAPTTLVLVCAQSYGGDNQDALGLLFE